MSVVPGGVDADQQPPMTVPLRHFVIGLAFLLAGALLGLLDATGAAVAVGVDLGWASLAHVHLLLIGWVCLTIMGAMTQFVPVWSGRTLHSRRFAVWQCWLVAGGLAAFAGALVTEWFVVLPTAGLMMLAGFCLFVYNVGRTLPALRELDRTEAHFAFALACFVAVAVAGVLLAVDVVRPLFGANGLFASVTSIAVSRADFVAAHATLAVFGAILATVLGALYQLGTMFTQTELHGVDHWFARVETVGYPAGVVALALGRLLRVELLASVGGVLVAVGIAAVGVVLARKLLEMRVAWTPMHRRYAVLVVTMVLWSALAARAFVGDPLAPATRYGAPGTEHLLAVGVIGFVVIGTLYHVVPFVVWFHRYSDLVGLEPVPAIDDLYDSRLALVELGLLVGGTGAIVAWELFGLDSAVGFVGGVGLLAGVALFVANILLVLVRHSPQGVRAILFGDLVALGSDSGE